MNRLLKRRGGVVAIAVTAGMLAWAGPAAAATGSGGGSGNYTYTNSPPGAGNINPICSKIDGDYVSSGWSGTYSDGTTTYTGPLDATHEYTVYAGPLFTYTTSACVVPGPGTVTAGASASTGPDANGVEVECTFTSGTFTRSSGTWTVEMTGSCRFRTNGGAWSTPSPTTETRTGTLTGCMGGGPPTSCSSVSDTYSAV